VYTIEPDPEFSSGFIGRQFDRAMPSGNWALKRKKRPLTERTEGAALPGAEL